MRLLADLHLHSRYSRAVSEKMVVSEMERWAQKKGVAILGTGDFTHPLWLEELKKQLVEERKGVFKVKNKEESRVRFLLTGEISSIYSQGGRVRKIHNLLVAPSFETVEKINTELKRRGGNLMADGRPIVGLPAKDLLKLVLEIDERCLFIPCHIWTPHFSLFGSESGFDSLGECFGEVENWVEAIETGLSSDPEMNWQVEELDQRTILSFSDAHSLTKIGREATLLEATGDDFDFEDLRLALRGKGEKVKIGGTIEFYPEEGKYHFTGHRNCKVVYSPEETAKKGIVCPVCGKRLTVGVMEQVRKLGRNKWVLGERVWDKMEVCWITKEGRAPFSRLVPLGEIIEEVLGVGEETKQAEALYERLIEDLGTEFRVLVEASLEEIERAGGEKLMEAVRRVRRGEIFVKPGFDGQYGQVKVWGEDKEEKTQEQMILFEH